MIQFRIILLVSLTLTNIEDSVETKKSNWDSSHGDLKVSHNKRFLVYNDGTPFFYMGDTNWELFHRARREDAEKLIEKRKQQGFNVMFAPVTGNLDAILYKNPFGIPNPYGDLPFIDKDVTRPHTTPGADPADEEQYDYWDHVDYIVNLAESAGIYIGLIPAWANHYKEGLINDENCRVYANFLGKRYGAHPNIIWVLGGDFNPAGKEELFREMATGLKESGGDRQLITFHPGGKLSSSQWFHNAEWLDFNMIQSGHYQLDLRNDLMITKDYGRLPYKPVIDSENRYEDHSVNWDPKNGWFNEYDNRQAAYWALFAGAFGHNYGNRGVWQMYEPGREPYGPLRYYWYDAMDLPGAWNMKQVRNLMMSRPMLSRVPDQSIVSENFDGSDHIQATRGDGYAFIYTPTGRTFSVNMGKITGEKVEARWFDPRTGEVKSIGKFVNYGIREFNPPGDPWRGNDWVLVLDDTRKKFPAPGKKDYPL
jgi:hypothetical protein